ncbi:MAG TPA: SiaC family regulatory phosphoprotein [Bacteroidales bacterium]|nr:SiaC family regulatory phosphoprotein [Bacteroidales bacterium]
MANRPEEVHIAPTNNTPEVLLNAGGVVKIFGRAIDESRTKFSDQMMTWIDSYILDPADKTEVTIALEYLNSFNSIYLSSVLRKLALVNEKMKTLKVKWYIEEDDEDLLERAEYIASTFSIPIEFEMTDHIKNWY